MLPCLVLFSSPWLLSYHTAFLAACNPAPNTSAPLRVKPGGTNKHRHWREPAPTLLLVRHKDTGLSLFLRGAPDAPDQATSLSCPKIQKAIAPGNLRSIYSPKKAEGLDEITAGPEEGLCSCLLPRQRVPGTLSDEQFQAGGKGNNTMLADHTKKECSVTGAHPPSSACMHCQPLFLVPSQIEFSLCIYLDSADVKGILYILTVSFF